ncbi:MAG TPA: alpha/beta hydrolase [Novosphingobium sp.]|nr:alpha/beta hydrolase [Novosphingobium sp.]
MSGILLAGYSGRSRLPDCRIARALPLVVALHGGTYTSAYFDIPGFSLLDRAEANGIPIIAIDRPGYGLTSPLPPTDATIDGQAAHLIPALEQLWDRFGADSAGIVLIGHSIGGAIAATIASHAGQLPLIGLAISGVGLRTPSAHRPMWEALPDLPQVEMPLAIKDDVMFGPPGSFDATLMPTASHIANASAPKAELVAIVSSWQDTVEATLSRIDVPVHYRQAENDKLWIVDEDQITGFAAALTESPRVDAEMISSTGHCMDFHHISAALQLQQLGFALQCAIEGAHL